MTRILDPYQPVPNPLLIVISGPSGAGKDKILKGMKERGLPFHFVVTTTDRPPRPEEVHGKDYYFVSTQEFEHLIKEDALLEHAIVYGQHKGIARDRVREALDSGCDVVMRLDVQGAATVRKMVPDSIHIFLSCESNAALEDRLTQRNTESKDSLRKRIEFAQQEMTRLEEFDYVVINPTDHPEKAVDVIESIIHAEKHRVWQRVMDL